MMTDSKLQTPFDIGATLSIGDCLVDLVEKEGEMVWYPGGAALNLAVGLARLGQQSCLAAQIGQDAHGMRLARYLRQEQVRLLATPSVDYTGVASSTRVNGEPVYHFNAPMQRRRMIPDEKIIAALQQSQAVAISSFAYDVPEQVTAFYDGLCSRQGELFLDPNPRPSMVRNMVGYKQGFEKIATLADYVKLSDEDIRIFYGEKADYASIAKQLHAFGVAVCLFTQGEEGAVIYVEGAQIVHVDIWRDPKPIVDTLGAGDATFAAFINWILRHGRPQTTDAWRDCLEATMKVAAATCRAFGGGLQLA